MNEDLYINLIYKELNKEISDLESKQLQEWLSQSEENRLTKESIELAWQSSGQLNQDFEFDLDQEFSRLEERIQADENVASPTLKPESSPSETKVLTPDFNNRTRRKKPISGLWLAAAAITLFLTASFLFNQFYSTNKEIVWEEVKTTADTRIITLADNSKITLNKNSQLKYPQEFSSSERRIFLNGEAFFEVEHQEKQPFIVETNYEEVRVLGTSFNVKAHSEDKVSVVAVAKGRVNVVNKKLLKNEVITKGEKVVNNRTNNSLTKDESSTPSDYIWYSKEFNFKDVPLSSVIQQLEQVYGVNVKLLNQEMLSCPFTSPLINKQIEDALQIIATVFGMELKIINKKSYQLIGGDC